MKRPKNTYWHFAPDNRRTQFDNRPIIIGQTMRVKQPIKLCERGLHASKRAIDALNYAPGAYVCLVTLGGEVIHGEDKSVATERTVIAAADATELLYRFAVDCAARAMERAGWEHEDSWNALAIRQAHLIGLADDNDLSAAARAAAARAAEAAWAAEAEAAARARAAEAAWAAWAAARARAAEAAWAEAAWAARAASWAAEAAWAAERETQNAELERRLLKLLKVRL